MLEKVVYVIFFSLFYISHKNCRFFVKVDVRTYNIKSYVSVKILFRFFFDIFKMFISVAEACAPICQTEFVTSWLRA
jgi:hypothetical protein